MTWWAPARAPTSRLLVPEPADRHLRQRVVLSGACGSAVHSVRGGGAGSPAATPVPLRERHTALDHVGVWARPQAVCGRTVTSAWMDLAVAGMNSLRPGTVLDGVT
ncbi:hypothetical protein DXZ75_10615 [Streptomyces sp. AcE210]|nr:hypothetical protein DXZ75_10615 [Streptomyces sp. AcE210]